MGMRCSTSFLFCILGYQGTGGWNLITSYSMPTRPHYPAEIWPSEASLFTQHHLLAALQDQVRDGANHTHSQLPRASNSSHACFPPQVARTPGYLQASTWEIIINEDLMALTLLTRFSESFRSAPGRSPPYPVPNHLFLCSLPPRHAAHSTATAEDRSPNA